MTRADRHALWIALAASGGSIGLAIIPHWGGRYDSATAVLTATLIAVIWYTFFTFQAVHRPPPVWINTGIRHERIAAQSRSVIEVSNPSPLVVSVRMRAAFWHDGKQVAEWSVTGDPDDTFFTLGPTETVTMQVPWPPLDWIPDGEGGGRYAFQDDLLRLDGDWRDNLGRAGEIQPKYWTRLGTVRVLSFREIARLQAAPYTHSDPPTA